MQPPESREQPLDPSKLNADGENSDVLGRIDATFVPSEQEANYEEPIQAEQYAGQVPYQPMALQTASEYSNSAPGFRVKLSDTVQVEAWKTPPF